MFQWSHPGETNKTREEGCPLVLDTKNANLGAVQGFVLRKNQAVLSSATAPSPLPASSGTKSRICADGSPSLSCTSSFSLMLSPKHQHLNWAAGPTSSHWECGWSKLCSHLRSRRIVSCQPATWKAWMALAGLLSIPRLCLSKQDMQLWACVEVHCALCGEKSPELIT